jgi:hypothetical protein
MPLAEPARTPAANMSKQTRPGTHRSRAAAGRPAAPPRACHLEAHPQQPYRLAGARHDPLRRALRRPPQGQARKGWPVPVQEHRPEHQRRHDRGRTPGQAPRPALTAADRLQALHRARRAKGHRGPGQGRRGPVDPRDLHADAENRRPRGLRDARVDPPLHRLRRAVPRPHRPRHRNAMAQVPVGDVPHRPRHLQEQRPS